jgi:predicted DNA-binding transcriptional regulator AlpA
MTINETSPWSDGHRYVTIVELADGCGVARSTARHWAAGTCADFPPVVRLPNRALLVERAVLDAWWAQRQPAARGLGRNEVTRRLRDDRREAPVVTMQTAHIAPDNDEQFLTLVEFAAYIRQSPHTVGKWLRRGGKHFPKHVRLPSRAVIIDRAAADRWLQERTS